MKLAWWEENEEDRTEGAWSSDSKMVDKELQMGISNKVMNIEVEERQESGANVDGEGRIGWLRAEMKVGDTWGMEAVI